MYTTAEAFLNSVACPAKTCRDDATNLNIKAGKPTPLLRHGSEGITVRFTALRLFERFSYFTGLDLTYKTYDELRKYDARLYIELSKSTENSNNWQLQ